MQYAGGPFTSLDNYENLMHEYKNIYNPEVIRMIYEINVVPANWFNKYYILL